MGVFENGSVMNGCVTGSENENGTMSQLLKNDVEVTSFQVAEIEK